MVDFDIRNNALKIILAVYEAIPNLTMGYQEKGRFDKKDGHNQPFTAQMIENNIIENSGKLIVYAETKEHQAFLRDAGFKFVDTDSKGEFFEIDLKNQTQREKLLKRAAERQIEQALDMSGALVKTAVADFDQRMRGIKLRFEGLEMPLNADLENAKRQFKENSAVLLDGKAIT